MDRSCHLPVSYHAMRGTIQGLIIFVLTLSLSACHFQAIRHNPIKAAFAANQFLKALYFDEDCAKARGLADERLRQAVTADQLKKMVDEIRQHWGALKKLRADSYLMTQGQTMELFYLGEYEKGVLYHRIVLIGDAPSGYRVTGVWFQPAAYPAHSLRRKFDVDIWV